VLGTRTKILPQGVHCKNWREALRGNSPGYRGGGVLEEKETCGGQRSFVYGGHGNVCDFLISNGGAGELILSLGASAAGRKGLVRAAREEEPI